MAEMRSVLVTGAASGIGRATSERLARNGWHVLACDRDAPRLAWTEGGAGVIGAVGDISSRQDNERFVAQAEAEFGRLDAVVLNAAAALGGGAIDAVEWDDFQRAIEVNMYGPVLGVRAALPALRRAGGGAIVITSSTMGLGGDGGNVAYVMAKHALIGLARSLARDLGWEGIRVNAVCPGLTRTGLTDTGPDAAAHFAELTPQIPLRRVARPEEIAGVIEFLISPAASYVSGHALVADGGAIAGIGLLPPNPGH